MNPHTLTLILFKGSRSVSLCSLCPSVVKKSAPAEIHLLVPFGRPGQRAQKILELLVRSRVHRVSKYSLCA